MRSALTSKLFATLVAQLGSRQANLELKWMKQHPQPNIPDMLRRRSFGEPLQYILGTQPFGPLNLLVRPPVLIPRPETEHWVMSLANHILSSSSSSPPRSLLDLGTGSGCIPLLLCHLLPPGSLHAHGIDNSTHALQLAADNAALCNLPQPSRHFYSQNTFKISRANCLNPAFPADAELAPPYDIITSNPPYIPWNEYLDLPREVTDYEDPKALFGGPSGLDFYYAIAHLIQYPNFLSPHAIIALEVGHGQAQAVENIICASGRVRHTEIWSDPWGRQRTVLAHL